ncbi:MAG: hypothetical protein JWO38_4024 [Gemmataceae bacterium]|nr:hypothetical protein [Gemmataceae bacterium]
MTPAESIRELFARLPAPGRDVVWLADEVISVAQHSGSITLPDPIIGTGPEGTPDLTSPFWRLFRPLLARIARLSADETGTEFDPYHGRYVLTRSGREGPVHLEILLTNTAAGSSLRITRVPAPTHPALLIGNGSAVHPAPPQAAG